ncbi:hypothetical protein ACFQU2_33740 [Siccirubricoccus deserti]
MPEPHPNTTPVIPPPGTPGRPARPAALTPVDAAPPRRMMAGRGILMDDAELNGWIGRSETAEDEVSLVLLRRLAALLDLDPLALSRGAPMPEGWHVVLFAPLARQSGLGPDGHGAKGEFLPPVPLPRRMFAGRRTWFNAPLAIGAEVRRVSASLPSPRSGAAAAKWSSSPSATASRARAANAWWRSRIWSTAPRRRRAPPPPSRRCPNCPRRRSVSFTPDTRLLFRYSAVTNNGHRIHYDADYARSEEGYPALVVNGGITTTKLSELAKRHLPGPLRSITTRAGRPLFVGRPVTLAAHVEAPGKVRLWALDDSGRLAFESVAECAA